MIGIEHVLDTNVVIGLLKGDDAALALAHQSRLLLSSAGVSQITRMELLGFPSLSPQEDRAVRGFLARCRVIGISEEVEAIAIRLRRSGALKLPDAIVAATVLSTGSRLLTLDQRLARVVQEQQSGLGISQR